MYTGNFAKVFESLVSSRRRYCLYGTLPEELVPRFTKMFETLEYLHNLKSNHKKLTITIEPGKVKVYADNEEISSSTEPYGPFIDFDKPNPYFVNALNKAPLVRKMLILGLDGLDTFRNIRPLYDGILDYDELGSCIPYINPTKAPYAAMCVLHNIGLYKKPAFSMKSAGFYRWDLERV